MKPKPTSPSHGEEPRGDLRASEDPFRTLVESVVDYGIFILDVTGHVASWNAGAQRMNGYAASEIIGKHFSIFHPRAEVEAGKCERELAIAEREGRFEEEGWRLRKDGSRFRANVVITAMRVGGELVGFGEVTRDLGGQQRDLEQLRQSEERLRLLITSVKDYAIFILDPTGHVATWNPGAERLKGYSAEDIIGQHFSRFYPEEDVRAGKCERELEGALRDGRFEDEGWRVRKDGTRFWANVVITPMRAPDGQGVLGFAKVTRDLSERRRHEEEQIQLARAEEARRQAEQATKMKDDFLATVSHELRTPLNAVLGWARMLGGGKLSPDKREHAVATIIRNASAQGQLIDDLLDVSRIISGQLRLEAELVDLNQVVASAIEVVRPAADAKGVALQWVLDLDTAFVRGDAGRLQQVLWNLLANAVKFTARGGHVHVALRRRESRIEVDVADTGRGIDPAFLPRMFDRFTQQETHRGRKAGGLGLGLAIVRHLVELHGGSVEAHSGGEGKGSTFVLKLPLAAVQPTRAESRAHSARGTEDLALPSELRGLKVLVLDDERDARELVKAVLEEGGALVTLAASVSEALESVRAHRPDVIVSDIGMPGEDGYGFIRRLRATSREEGGRTPALALTAYAHSDDRRAALLAGFQNHAAKPIEPQELAIVVANLAGRYA